MGWYESCLKPIIEIATLIGVIVALIYQNSVISSQRKEFKRQKIRDNDADFKSLLNMFVNDYNTFIEKNIIISNKVGPYKQSIIYTLNIIFNNYNNKDFTQYLTEEYRGVENYVELEISNYVFNEKAGITEDFIKPYLSLINNGLTMLDRIIITDLDSEKNFNLKKQYFKYFFTRLNDYEIHLLIIFCLSNEGKEMKGIVEKYSLLGNRKIYNFYNKLKEHFKSSAFVS